MNGVWGQVWYFCPSCRERMPRAVQRATKTRKSYCEKAGKTVTMRRLKPKG